MTLSFVFQVQMANAISQEDFEAISGNSIFYDPNASQCDAWVGGIDNDGDLDRLSTAIQWNSFTEGELMEDPNPTAIVVHWTGGNYTNDQQIVDILKDRTSTDYPGGRRVQLFVNDEGVVYQLTSSLRMKPIQTMDDDPSWNDVSIGIEIETKRGADASNFDELEEGLLENEAQYQSVINTIKELMAKFNIQNSPNFASKQGIFGHFEANSGNSDPGPNYLAKILDEVSDYVAPNVGTTPPISDPNCICSVGNTALLASGVDAVWNYIRSKGISEIHTAGFVGNFAFESGFDPTAVNPNGGAFGLAQWLGSRKDTLYAYAAARSLPVDALQTQLEFWWWEVDGSESIPGMTGGYESGALSRVQETTSVADAAVAVDRYYERSEQTHHQQRIDAAEAAFASLAGSAIGSTSASNCGGLGIIDGFVFPIIGNQSQIDWCNGTLGNCHGEAWVGTYYAYDIWAYENAPVVAVEDGTIVGFSPSYNCSAGGQLSMWVHTDNDTWYFYQHLDASLLLTSAGDRVTAGQTIGQIGPNAYVGGTCTNTPPHLHFAASTTRTSMYRGCTESDCPGMAGLFDVAPNLKAAYEQLPL